MDKRYIGLILREFDGYQLVYMARTDQEGHGTILGTQSLFFKDGNPIKIGRKIRLDDVRDFLQILQMIVRFAFPEDEKGKGCMNIQIFGTKKSNDTTKAELMSGEYD